MIFVFYWYKLALESDKFFWVHLSIYILIFYNNFYDSIRLNHVTQRYQMVYYHILAVGFCALVLVVDVITYFCNAPSHGLMLWYDKNYYKIIKYMCLNTSKKIYHFLAAIYTFEKCREFVCFLYVVCINNKCV